MCFVVITSSIVYHITSVHIICWCKISQFYYKSFSLGNRKQSAITGHYGAILEFEQEYYSKNVPINLKEFVKNVVSVDDYVDSQLDKTLHVMILNLGSNSWQGHQKFPLPRSLIVPCITFLQQIIFFGGSKNIFGYYVRLWGHLLSNVDLS